MPAHNSLDGYPLISVIAISYNHEKYLIDTLESIRAQKYPNMELIYCDDASTDRSVEIAINWLSRSEIAYRTIIHEHNQGLCPTLNELIKEAAGEFIQFVACDDKLMPGKLIADSRLLNSLPSSTVVVCGDAQLIDSTSRPCKPYRFSRLYGKPDSSDREKLFKRLLQGNCISAPSALIRKSVFSEVGLYDVNLPYEDYDMWLRILRDHDIYIQDNCTVLYRIHNNNYHQLLANDNTHLKVKYAIVSKHLDHPDAKSQLRQEIRSMLVNNHLVDNISYDQLILCGYQLQDIADLIAELQSGRCYQACQVLKKMLSFISR